jgi:hypothetical protein
MPTIRSTLSHSLHLPLEPASRLHPLSSLQLEARSLPAGAMQQIAAASVDRIAAPFAPSLQFAALGSPLSAEESLLAVDDRWVVVGSDSLAYVFARRGMQQLPNSIDEAAASQCVACANVIRAVALLPGSTSVHVWLGPSDHERH